MMNIWCISKYASPAKYSKMPARLFYLCQEWIKSGHNVTLFTSDANHLAEFPETTDIYNKEIIDTVPVYWLKTKKYKKTTSLGRILSWFDFERLLFCFKRSSVEKPDVVIVSSLSILSILYGFFLKVKYKAFLVFEIRDIWPLTMTEEAGFSKWHPLVLFIGLVEKFGYKVSDLIVGTMPRLDLHVENILGHKHFNFHCAPLGFHPENYNVTFNDIENPFSKIIPSDKVVVGYAGSMGITNSLEPFISVIKDLKCFSNIHFIMVGSGDLRAKFETDLLECDNVTFLPRIQQNEVKFLLEKCDILYLSTQHSKVWNYGQSMNKVVEYMLAAKPIVASYTGYPTMINEASCGVFVSPKEGEHVEVGIKDALLSIAQMTPDARNEMGSRGRDWVYKNRSYKLLAEQYLSKIESLMPSFDRRK
ncbi:glycosyltransferase family 4 protein [Acinetobacter sp. C26M]|uniref:glycosyltransferase family 4 protein n=1 Tax=unclassified Acinetobacter TaxID=196816 RepID=UPI00203759BC|nr:MULTISPECIES: glycosyltransferase family 4 protein [unclassified Acinetobacter]USA46482.1 glycosyltransferase family 4 protein [Acinetobacter sp. C26M]USA49966.1 glycosyltransferase family 4 protein [Acinetobacter sp. C26G]